MRLVTISFLSSALVLFAPIPASAFNYDEHCRLSNNALRIAIASVSARYPAFADSLPRLREILRADSGCTGPKAGGRSYGDLVSQVDWARAPGDFFLADLPRGEGDIATTDMIPWNRIEALVRSQFQDYRALHENAEHFGGRALFYFDAWHNQGVALAARGNLAAALVFNSFADHYLQDHFAPGHIYTPRSGLTDLITANMHDYYNRRGAYYRAANTDSLADLFFAAGYPASVPSDFLDIVRKGCPEKDGTQPDTVFIRACLQQFAARDTLRLHGDGLLRNTPAQELFVTLVIARSVADVLESWLSRTASEHFGEKRWCGYVPLDQPGVEVEHWRSPVATIRYGTYRPENGSGFPRFDHPWIIAGAVEAVPGTGEVRISLATERFLSGWAGSNWLGDQSESLKGAFSTNESTYVGYELFGGCEYDPLDGCRGGIGGYLRFLYPVTRINSQLSILSGVRISTPPSGGRGPALSLWGGLGPEAGFSVFNLGGRIQAEVTLVQGREPAVYVGFASTTQIAVPRRFFLPPKGQDPIRTPVSLEEAKICASAGTKGQGLWISGSSLPGRE